MPNSPLRRNALTPDALQMMDIIARTGSFAAAARKRFPGGSPSSVDIIRRMRDTRNVPGHDDSTER